MRTSKLFQQIAAWSVMIAMTIVPRQSIADPSNGDPCAGLSFIRVRQGAAADVPFTSKPPAKPAAAASPAPPNLKVELPPGVASIDVKDANGKVLYTVQSHDGSQIATAAVTFYTPPPAPTKAPQSNAQSTPTPSPTPDSLYPGGVPGQPTAFVVNTHIASLTSSPAPSPSGSPSPQAAQSVTFKVAGLEAGTTRLVITDGSTRCYVAVAVIPIANRFGVSAGIGTSSVVAQSFTSSALITPAPTPTPAPGTPAGPPLPNTLIVYRSESSGGQTFVPILASYRLTDFPHTFNLFATAGLAASGEKTKQLYGLSYGNQEFLLTLGEHSQNADFLSPGLQVGTNTLPGNIPAPPLTFNARVTRPFVAVSFQLCLIAKLIPGLGGGDCPTSSSPSTGSSSAGTGGATMPSPSPAPSPKS